VIVMVLEFFAIFTHSLCIFALLLKFLLYFFGSVECDLSALCDFMCSLLSEF